MTTSTKPIALFLPAPITDAIASFLDTNPKWSIERLAIAAFSQYLLQESALCGVNRHLARLYLDALFAKQEEEVKL